MRLSAVACVNRPARCNRAISYHTLPPPIWAGIVADDESDPLPLMAIPGPPRQLTLSKTSTCPCKEPRITFDIQRDKVIRRCQVYGLTEACSFEIEVQKCPSCEHGYIGPECTDSGLFNLNNHSLFTLTLLDDYTCSFSRSETPFASWVSSTACRYQNHRSSIPFIGEKAFRSAWFAYIRLVHFDNDMICPRCGLTPKVTIWDGVTLAFSKKNLLPTIWPPTRTDKQSEVKPAIKPSPNLQIFPERALRKLIQKILIGPPLRLPELSEDSDCANVPTRDDQEMMERIELVPQVVSRLSEECLELGLLFRRCFSMSSLLITKTPPKEYRELYVQVLTVYTSSAIRTDQYVFRWQPRKTHCSFLMKQLYWALNASCPIRIKRISSIWYTPRPCTMLLCGNLQPFQLSTTQRLPYSSGYMFVHTWF